MARLDQQLSRLRGRIDGIDKRIVRLLNQRTDTAVAIGKIKHQLGYPVFAPTRENDVIERVAASSRGPLRLGELRAIYREIMSAALTFEGGLVVGLLKSDGPLARAVVRQRFGESTLIRAYGSQAVLQRAVVKGDVSYALLSSVAWKKLKVDPAIRSWSVAERLRFAGAAGPFVLVTTEQKA